MSDRLFDPPPPEDAGDRTVAARVPLELRRELEERARLEDVDLSTIIRRALEAHLRPPNPAGPHPTYTVAPGSRAVLSAAGALGSLNTLPPSHAGDPGTSRTAAALAWPEAGHKRRLLLEEVARRPDGMTSDEAVLFLGYSGQRRLHDLKRAGYVEPLLDEAGRAVTRDTRRGRPAEVLTVTPLARKRLEREARAA